jgi:trichohyalin
LRKLEEEERKYLEEMKRRRERLEGLQSMPISDSKKEEERKCKEEEEKKRKEEEDRKKMEEEKKVS